MSRDLLTAPLDTLTVEELRALVARGEAAHSELQRVLFAWICGDSRWERAGAGVLAIVSRQDGDGTMRLDVIENSGEYSRWRVPLRGVSTFEAAAEVSDVILRAAGYRLEAG